MHVRFTNDGPPLPAVHMRGKPFFTWALLLLGLGHFLLLAAPLWSSRTSARSWLGEMAGGTAWLPVSAALGLSLLGVAALIVVIARLVREVEQYPYASIAPVLTVLAGVLLDGMHAKLELPGVPARQLGLLVLALALLGGVFVGRPGWSERTLGWCLSVLPSLALLCALAALQGEPDPIALLRHLSPSVRTYLLLLTVSSLALGGVAMVARRPANPSARPSGLDAYDKSPPGLAQCEDARAAHSRPRLERAAHGDPSHAPVGSSLARGVAHFDQGRRTMAGSVSRAQHRLTGGSPGAPSAPPSAPQRRPGPTSYPDLHVPPAAGKLALDDPDLILLTRRRLPLARIATAAAVMAATGWVGSYFFVVQPRARDQERARIHGAGSSRASEGATNEALSVPAAERGRVAVPAVEATSSRSLPSVRARPTPANELTLVPIVTSLRPQEAPVVASDVRTVRPAPRASHPRERVGARRNAHAAAAQRAPSVPEHRAASQESESALRHSATLSARASAPPKLVPEAPNAAQTVVATTTKNDHGRSLDLDDLVQQALPGGGVDASEDPILGL